MSNSSFLDAFLRIATGRSIYSTYFLVVLMIVAPAAFFTDYIWLDNLAWLMLVIIGFFVLITGFVTRSDAAKSFRWPRVEAKLKNASFNMHSSNGSIKYSPKINCTFKVKGKEYNGTEYDFSASYTSKEKAQEKNEKIKAMSPLLVHYKPEDPSISVIYPGTHFVHYLRVITGSATIIIAAMSWIGVIHWG